MNKSELNREISLKIKELNYVRQNPQLSEEDLQQLLDRISELILGLKSTQS